MTSSARRGARYRGIRRPNRDDAAVATKEQPAIATDHKTDAVIGDLGRERQPPTNHARAPHRQERVGRLVKSARTHDIDAAVSRRDDLSQHTTDRRPPAYAPVRRDGHELETSLGAIVPHSIDRPVLPLS